MHSSQIVQVRAATLADLPRVYDLLRMMHRETPHAPLCEDRMQETVDGTVALGDGLALVSLDADGVPVGTCGLALQSPWFSRETWLHDIWFFVHPAHRRTPHARSLLAACKGVAEEQGVPLQMAVTGYGDRTAGKIRLFSRVLGQPSGAIWTMRG